LLVRFAGNEKGVAYQIEGALAQLKRAEVVPEDGQLWQTVAAAPFWSECVFSWRTSVFPSELPAFCERVAEAGSTWQVGALDGRVRLFDNDQRSVALFDRPNSAALSSLMQRVKHKLDPLNTLPRINAD
jgi:hypothetical protein